MSLKVQIAGMSFLALTDFGGGALADDVFYPTEPPIADSGWTVRYNELLLSCYRGTMEACDRVSSDRGMVFDTAVYNYAATCGGRLDIVTARRLNARMLENGVSGGMCAYALTPE